MTAQHESFPIVEFWIDKFADWIKHRRDLSEIRRMNRTDFDLIARDLRVSADDLERLVQAGEHSADEMPKMLKALGIDVADLMRVEPLMVRDMQRVCGLCQDKAHCHGELADGVVEDIITTGLSSRETIEALEAIGAEVVRQEGKLGTVAPGAFADLLVVDGDPLKNLGLFKDGGPNLSAIMKGGRFHKNTL